MARVHFVKKARKDVGDIKAGESYFWWKFRFGSKHVSKTRPRRSQLTQSEYYGNLYDIEDEIGALVAGDNLEGDVSDIASRLRDIASEQEDKLSNMPDSLQYSPTGELLQQRADDCNQAADELENVNFEEPDEDATEEEIEDHWQNVLDEVQGVSIDIN